MTRREQILRAIATLATEAKMRATVLEGEALRRGDAEERKKQRREWARWDARDLKAQRLLVRADYSPTARRDRDEEQEADRMDQAIWGLRRGESPVQPWEFRDES